MDSQRIKNLRKHVAELTEQFGEDSSTVKDWTNYLESVEENVKKQTRINGLSVFS